MTIALAVVALGLAAALAATVARQRETARRLTRAAHRLHPDGAPATRGLAGAAGVVERAVEAALDQDDEATGAGARLVSALDMIPQGIVVFDGDGSVGFRNEAAAAFLDARHGEALVGEAIRELAALVTSEEPVAPTRDVDLVGPPRRSLLLRAFPVSDGSAPPSALVVIDDVTDRRRLEGVRRDFVANISHELKTPVGALGLLAETLVAEVDPEVIRRLAGRMVGEAFRVAHTIDDLLELSRLEVDDDAPHEELAVTELVVEAVERVGGAADNRRIRIEVAAAPDDPRVHGDRRQLVSAVYNLLDNAVKYSEPGSSVQVGTRRNGAWVDVSVEDHGVGIPVRDLERVFERFYRVDRARSRETGGTGLGLAIVRHVIQNHHGEVLIESAEGQGSTFTLRLPEAGAAAPDGGEAG